MSIELKDKPVKSRTNMVCPHTRANVQLLIGLPMRLPLLRAMTMASIGHQNMRISYGEETIEQVAGRWFYSYIWPGIHERFERAVTKQ